VRLHSNVGSLYVSYINHLFAIVHMAYQTIDAELQKCKAELHMYLGTMPNEVKTRQFDLNGKYCVLSMDVANNVWVTIDGLTPSKYYYHRTVPSSGHGFSSTEVPWMYVLDYQAFVIDFNTYEMRCKLPSSSFIKAGQLKYDRNSVWFNIETYEFVVTSGGGYSMQRTLRRVEFHAR